MLILLILCDLLFVGLAGAGIALSTSSFFSPLIFFIIPCLVLTFLSLIPFLPINMPLPTITIPNPTSKELLAKFKKDVNPTYVNSDYKNWDFAREVGKTFEVLTWKPGKEVSSQEVRDHFKDLEADGNVPVFIAWITETKPAGYHVSIPSGDDLLYRDSDDHLYAPYFRCGGFDRGLGLSYVEDDWRGGCVFVAFRQIKNGIIIKVDKEDEHLLEEYSWSLNSDGYPSSHIDGKTKCLHQIILGKKEGFEIDHIDRNPLNNCRLNLRYVTHHQNMMNTSKQKNNTSGFRGVTWDRHAKKWAAQIFVNGKHLHLGLYTDIMDAAAAYKAEALIKFEEFIGEL